MLISAGGWACVSSWAKRSSVKPGAGSNVDWKVLLVNDYRRDQTQAAATCLPRVDSEVGCTLSTLGETGQKSPLPHTRNTAGGTLPVLGDVRIHCTKACSPCDPALHPRDGGPFPDLSRFQPEGFGLSVPMLGILEVAWQSDDEGRKASLGRWCKKASRWLFSCTSCPSSSWWPSSLSCSKVPVRPHGAGWWQPGRGQPCRPARAGATAEGSGAEGRWEARESPRKCFSITGTHFCSSQRCWKASYVTCCEGLGHSWSGICKQTQQFNLKKRQVVSHASSLLAYFRLPDLSAPWCCLFHC